MTQAIDEYGTEETALFGEQQPGGHEDQADEPGPIEPPERSTGKPGPKANPNSQRQKKLAAAAARRNTVSPPAKRPVKSGSAKPAAAAKSTTTDGQTEIYQRGAIAVLGWVARPLAMASLAAGISSQSPRLPEAKREKALALAQALTLDSLTIAAYEKPLAEGLATAAPHIPFLAQALEKAAAISPFASLLEASMSMLLQVACNHGLVPVSDSLGTLGAEALAAAAGVVIPEVEG